MEKTKEEIIVEAYLKRAEAEDEEMILFTKLECLYLMREYGQQCRKEGFESFREKAEEGVKKQNNYAWQPWGMDENSKLDIPIIDRFVLRDEVLITIKDIKP
jgi:hypothetical protein